MEYKRIKDRIFLRLEKGEEICASIKEVAKKENVAAAAVSGIGATDDFTVGVFDTEKKAYEEYAFSGNHEINAIVGNVSEKDGEPYVHLHITCTGKGAKVVGGHLLSGVISLTAEIVIDVSGCAIGRKRDDALCINLWDL